MSIKSGILYALSIVFLVLSVGIFLNPKVRSYISKIFKDPNRYVLATLRPDLGIDREFKIMKIKTPEGISVEIYPVFGSREAGSVFSRIFTQSREGYLNVKGRASNLMAMDIDNDGVEEILIPLLEADFSPMLYILKYNMKEKKFTLLQENEVLGSL